MDFYNEYDTEIFNKDVPLKTIPILIDIIYPHKINSVIDLGCGIGTWLSAFKQYKVEKIIGIDGLHIKKEELLISLEEFKAIDLTKFNAEIFSKFDLAISLEVAEHLPANYAKEFIYNLTKLSDIILFSAAIPGQRGYKHINCQWPGYWVELFASHGFEVIDIIRQDLLKISDIEYWYKQNIMLFTKNINLLQKYNSERGKYMEIVSKELYTSYFEECCNFKNGNLGTKFALQLLIKSIRNKIRTKRK